MSEDGISRARAFLRISCLIVRVSCIVAYFVLDTSPREPRLRSGSHPYTRTYTLTHTTHSGVHTYTHTTHSGQNCFTWPRVITGLSRYLSPPPFCHPELWALPLERSPNKRIELVLALPPPQCHAILSQKSAPELKPRRASRSAYRTPAPCLPSKKVS